MPLQKEFMATPLKEYFDQAYTDESLIPGVAGSAAGEEASGRQGHADDCGAIAGVNFTESPSEKSTSHVYNSVKKRMNVQHFLQAASIIVGKNRHPFRSNSNGVVC